MPPEGCARNRHTIPVPVVGRIQNVGATFALQDMHVIDFFDGGLVFQKPHFAPSRQMNHHHTGRVVLQLAREVAKRLALLPNPRKPHKRVVPHHRQAPHKPTDRRHNVHRPRCPIDANHLARPGQQDVQLAIDDGR